MAEPQQPDWLADVPPKLREDLFRCAAGLPANVALMHLLMECSEEGEAEWALRRAAGALEKSGAIHGAGRLVAALELLHANPQAFSVVRTVISGLDHGQRPSDPSGLADYWAGAFDAVAVKNPEASVALYALGNPDLLAAATGEVVAKLGDWGLISGERECLDLGCGIGRFVEALAPRLKRVVGVDVSEEMVSVARQRCAALPNVGFRRIEGGNLEGFAASAFDLVLAADCFPYIVQSGPEQTRRMLCECMRVLRPAGHLAILNFSYRGDLQVDRKEISEFAAESGARVIRDGSSDLRLWDAAAFVLQKTERGTNQGSM